MYLPISWSLASCIARFRKCEVITVNTKRISEIIKIRITRVRYAHCTLRHHGKTCLGLCFITIIILIYAVSITETRFYKRYLCMICIIYFIIIIKYLNLRKTHSTLFNYFKPILIL